MGKESFIFYRDWRDGMQGLEPSLKAELYEAIVAFALDGDEIELSAEAKMIFSFIRPKLLRDAAKYDSRCNRNRENGKKGGRPPKTEETHKNPKNPLGFSETHKNPKKQVGCDKDKDNDKDKDIIPPKPPQGSEPQKKKPLWKESYDEWRRLFLEAKNALLNDSEFKNRQSHYYPNIDYVKTIEKNCDYWLREETWKEEKRKRVQTINAALRIKNNFDKNKVFLPLQRKNEEHDREISLQERHGNFMVWLSNQVNDKERVMPIFNVTLDNFIEMFNSCGRDANKLATTVKELLRGRITVEDGMIGAFRKYMEGKK